MVKIAGTGVPGRVRTQACLVILVDSAAFASIWILPTKTAVGLGVGAAVVTLLYAAVTARRLSEVRLTRMLERNARWIEAALEVPSMRAEVKLLEKRVIGEDRPYQYEHNLFLSEPLEPLRSHLDDETPPSTPRVSDATTAGVGIDDATKVFDQAFNLLGPPPTRATALFDSPHSPSGRS